MTIQVTRDGVIELVGICSAEEGEILLQNLLAGPKKMVDWRGCESAHTSVIQVLMAARPKLLGPPSSALLETWVQPMLAATMLT